MAIYQRHTPETTVFYQTIARVWPGLFMEYAASDAPIADHIETEFDRFFALLASEHCGDLIFEFIAYSQPQHQFLAQSGHSRMARPDMMSNPSNSDLLDITPSCLAVAIHF